MQGLSSCKIFKINCSAEKRNESIINSYLRIRRILHYLKKVCASLFQLCTVQIFGNFIISESNYGNQGNMWSPMVQKYFSVPLLNLKRKSCTLYTLRHLLSYHICILLSRLIMIHVNRIFYILVQIYIVILMN